MPSQPAQQPSPDLLGSVLRRYREHELQVSQGDLAWLAAVSRGTISNLETGRVTPDPRTLHRIRTALALPPSFLSQAATGTFAMPMISGDGLRGIIQAILAIRDRDADAGRQAAERWRRLIITVTRENGQGWQAANADLAWLVHDVAPMAPHDKYTAVHDALRGLGAAPASASQAVMLPSVAPEGLSQVQELMSSINHLTEQLRVYQDRARGFERLPVQVQDLLNQGVVVSCDIASQDDAPAVSVISLITRNEVGAPPAAQQDALDAARRWSAIVVVARHIVEKLAPHLSAEEIIKALKSGLETQSPAEVSELVPSARRGDPVAMYNLARALKKNGRPDEAELWLRRAAEAGHPGALFNLGNLAYEDDRREEAERWLRNAAEAGHPDAMHRLWGLLREDNPREAEKWLRQAATAGSRKAMYRLWTLHRKGANREDAERWLRQAAASGHREALADLSQLVTENGSQDEAVRWLHRAAEAGDSGAMSKFEFMLYERQQQGAASRTAG